MTNQEKIEEMGKALLNWFTSEGTQMDRGYFLDNLGDWITVPGHSKKDRNGRKLFLNRRFVKENREAVAVSAREQFEMVSA